MANDTTPLLLITNAGLAAASQAMPEGPYIHIVKFQIGSGYGYTPDPNQTALRGNILYGGDSNNPARPTTYRYIGDNTLNVICEIPPAAGPWEFGEIGLFVQDGSGNDYLFAIAVFQSPQTKFSSLGTNVVSSYTLNCLLKLQQSVAIFQISTIQGSPNVVDIYQWSDVYPPVLSADPDVQIYNIRELSSLGEGTLLETSNDNTRSMVDGAYAEIWPLPSFGGSSFIVQAASSTYIQVPQSQLGAARVNSINSRTPNRSLVVQTHAGFWRSVASITAVGSNYQLNLNSTNDGTYNNYPLPVVPQVNEVVHIYSDYFEGKQILYEQIIDPPSIPLATTGTPGLATAGSGLYVSSPGTLAAVGLLQTPSQGTGRILSSTDDLNNTTLPSGLYNTYIGVYGIPANMPVNWEGSIWIHNLNSSGGSDIAQIYWPLGNGGGTDNAGDNGYPAYYRSYAPPTGWSHWFPFSMPGKLGSSSFTTAHAEWQGQSSILTWNATSSPAGSGLPALTKAGVLHMYVWDDGSRNTQVNLNGIRVSYNTKGGGAGYGRIHHDTVMFNAGDQVDWILTSSGLSPIGAAMILLG